MAGVIWFFPCSVCGDEAHPNAPAAVLFLGHRYLHLREWAAWKLPGQPRAGWKAYDHKARVK